MKPLPTRPPFPLVLCLLTWPLAAPPASAANWPAWRGPNGDSTTLEREFPTTWSATEQVTWKVPLPGPGNSSPVVWEDKVFIAQADEKDHSRVVMCFDRERGTLRWQGGTVYDQAEKTHHANPYCAASPVTDGERVIATFGSAGVFCFDMEGRELWRRDLGPQSHIWGNASSPLLLDDLCLLYHGPGEGAAMVALDKHTGEVRWQVSDPPVVTAGRTDGFRGKEPGVVGSFSTPVLIRIEHRPQLVMSYPNQVVALDPVSGRRVWWFDGLNPLVYTSPVWNDTHLVAMGGYVGTAIALRPGGEGDITESRRIWRKVRYEGGIGSGVIQGEYLYFHDGDGTASCLELATGTSIWEERVSAGGGRLRSWSSMTLAGDRIYLLSQSGEMAIVRASPQFELIAVNRLDDAMTNSTQAMSDGQLFIRTHTHLWCIGDRLKPQPSPPTILPAQAEDKKLEQLFQAYLEEHFTLRPTRATRLGDHRFDHLLDDVSQDARRNWEDLTRRTLTALPERVSYPGLSPSAQIDFEIFKHALERDLWLTRNTRPFEEDPRIYGQFISGAVYPLLAQSTLPLETNVANSLSRMKQIPRVLEAARESLDHPPRVMVETAIRQNRGAIQFFDTDIFTLAGETQQRERLQSSAAEVAAALRKHQTFLEDELLPRSQGNWRLGGRKFAEKLELVLDAGLTADQVLADARAEFDRVRHEMYVIARQLWSGLFPDRVLPPDDEEGRRETTEIVLDEVGNDHGRPEDLVDNIKSVVAELRETIRSKDLLRLPEPDRCRVIEMPEFRRGNATAYMNSPPPLDSNAMGYYAISPPPRDWDAERVRSYLEEYNSHMLKILTIHEAYPGHYVQFEYTNRHPSLIRKVLSSGVFVEGWAVYTEQTLLDQGYGNGDLALRLTQLKFYLRAVANAILDHRMHCEDLSDADALTFLTREAFQSEGEARLKVIRSKQSSTQLSTYFVGRMAHHRLRQKIEREQGDQFSLGAYHEAVLDQGPIPVKYLPALVRNRLKRPR